MEVIKIGVTNNWKTRLSRQRCSYDRNIYLLTGVRLDDLITIARAIHRRLFWRSRFDFGSEWYAADDPKVLDTIEHMKKEAAGHDGWLESVVDSWKPRRLRARPFVALRVRLYSLRSPSSFGSRPFG
jgi:hypothetical protein